MIFVNHTYLEILCYYSEPDICKKVPIPYYHHPNLTNKIQVAEKEENINFHNKFGIQ